MLYNRGSRSQFREDASSGMPPAVSGTVPPGATGGLPARAICPAGFHRQEPCCRKKSHGKPRFVGGVDRVTSQHSGTGGCG